MDFLLMNDYPLFPNASCTGRCDQHTCGFNTCKDHCFANVHCNPRMDPYFKDTPSN